MKTPIEVKDIRRGDLIRAEVAGSEVAIERRAMYDGDKGNLLDSAYYLLDRPTPPVELPTEPTLGWLSFEDRDHWCGLISDIEPSDGVFEGRRLDTGYYSECWRVDKVTAFTPATAVPTGALDELRAHIGRISAHSVLTTGDLEAVRTFLTAVDRASGATR